ncbi:MAG: hypothetical protein LBB94_03865 [Clostridiales bacterium]|nr:hypothetical protein [Clostridiales bacterium]
MRSKLMGINDYPFEVRLKDIRKMVSEEEGGGYSPEILAGMTAFGYVFKWHGKPWMPTRRPNANKPPDMHQLSLW